jgi:filamentous hemagglutinin family protein
MALMPERLLRLTPLALALGLAFQGPVFAVLPTGPQVTAGSAQIGTSGNAMTVTNAPNTVINWNTFSIGQGNAVSFAQQSSSSVVLNRVVGGQLSDIQGRLSSNGQVFLINPSGILVGAGAVIDTAAFVASTLPMLDADFLQGRLRFSGDGASGSIVNHGMIRTGVGGRVILAAPLIENAPAYDGQGVAIPNTGLISAPGGKILLAAGQKLTVGSLDLEGIQFEVQAPTDAVLNVGRLLADGGAVNVLAGTLRHSGDIRANSLTRDEAGQIVLRAKGDIELSAGSLTRSDGRIGGGVTIESASGRTRVEGQVSAIGSTGAGGRVDVFGETVSLGGSALVNVSGASGGGSIRLGGDYQGANPDVRNARLSFVGSGVRLRADATREGDGGRIIVWADEETRFLGSLSARGGPNGGNGGFSEVSGKGELLFLGGANLGAAQGVAGSVLLDPLDLFIDTRGGINPAIIDETTDFPDNAATVSPATLAGIVGNVTLFASRDMRFNSAITLTGNAQGLSAQAGRDLQIGAGITTAGGAVSLNAGRNLSTFGTSAINTGGGNVTITAGQAISGSSFNINAGTGSVTATSAAGSLSAGIVSGSGGINLASTGGNLNTSTLTSTGAVTLTSTGSISTGSVTSGAALAMTAPGFVSTGNLTTGGGTVNVQSSGSSVGTGNINTVAGAGPAGGAVTLSATSSSVSTSSITAGNANVGLSGTSVSTGTITTTANVSLVASDGNVSATVNDAAAVTATASRSAGSTSSASVSLSSSSATTALNATTVTATAGNCSFSSSCPSANVSISGLSGVNVGTVTATAPATSNQAVPFNSVSESVTINGQNGPILAMSPTSQVTAANVTLQTTQGAGGGIGTIATPLRVDVERTFTFRPNGEFGVLLNGSGPNQLSMQLGVAATGLNYTGSLSRPGQITLAATATDTAVTVSNFTITGGFNDLVFSSGPSVSLDVPNGSLIAQNVNVPAGDQVGRIPPFSITNVIQGLPVTLSGRDGLTVSSYTRAAGGFAKSTAFSSSLGAVTLGTINADRDPVSINAGADMSLTGGLTTRGNVTINAATAGADTGNVTIGGAGIDTTTGTGNVSITASSAIAGQGEIRSGTDGAGLEVTSGGTVTLNARAVDTAGFGNPFDVSGTSVSITTSGPTIGHTAAPVTANTTNLTINAAGEFNVDTGSTDLLNLAVTASPSGVGNGGLARVTTNANAYPFASDGANFTLANWTAAGNQFAGGTLSFTSTAGNITLTDISFSATQGNLSLRTNQLVTGNITQTPASVLSLGSGVLTLRADNVVTLDDVTAGGLSISQSNNQVFSPVFSSGSCETIGGNFVCAPLSVLTGSLLDPTGSGSFSIIARHGITVGNLQVGNLNFTNYEGLVSTGSIGTTLAPSGSVNISSGIGSASGSINLLTSSIEADSVSMSTVNGNIQTGAINAVNTGASSVNLTANNGSVTVSGTIDAAFVQLGAGGSGTAGIISVGDINPDAVARTPASIGLFADNSITAGTLDAGSIDVSGFNCCPTFPTILTGAIGSRLPGNSVRIWGSTVTLGGNLLLDLTGTGQNLDLLGLGTIAIAGNVSAGQGSMRLDAGDQLLINGGTGSVAVGDGSVLRLRAGNADTTTPFAFASITAGPGGDVGIDAPAGILQTLEGGNGGGITGAIVNLSATSAGAAMRAQEGTNPPTSLTLRQVTDLTLSTGGSVDIAMPDSLPLSNLDISRSDSTAAFSLTGFAAGQSATITNVTGGVQVGADTPNGTPMRFRYQNGDGTNSAIEVLGINSKGGQVIVDSTFGNVDVSGVSSIDPSVSGSGAQIEISAAGLLTNNGTIDGGSGSVLLNGAGIVASEGSSIGSTSFVRLIAANGDIGTAIDPAAISAPTVQLISRTAVGASAIGHTYADLTGTTTLVLDADRGFNVNSTTALTDLSVTTRGDQAGAVALTVTGGIQTYGFARNASALDVTTIASPTPLSTLSINVTSGDLRIVGTGVSSIAANDVSLNTTGILTLDGSATALVLANQNQNFRSTLGAGDVVVLGQASLSAATSQVLSANRDVLIQGGTLPGQSVSISSLGSQSVSAGRDIRLLGGSDTGTSVALTLNGAGSQSLSASRNIDLLGGSGSGASITVTQAGASSQSLSASGNLTASGGTGDNASVTVGASGSGGQSLFAGNTLSLSGGGVSTVSSGASVLVAKSGSGTQTLDAGVAITLTGGDGDSGSVSVTNTGTGDQVIGDNFCCSDPTDSLSLQGGDGLNSFALIDTVGRQSIRPAVALNLAGGAGDGAYARIHTSDTTSASTSVSGGPQIIGYSNSFDCCSGDQIDTIALSGGGGVGAFAEITSAGSQRVAFGTSLTATGGTGSGAYAKVAALAQDVRTGNVSLVAGTGNNADASIESTGVEANRTSGAVALQVIDPTNLTMTAGGTAGANTAVARISSGGTQRITASTTAITGGVGPNSRAEILSAGNQNVNFGVLTLQGGTGSNTRAAIESASGGQSLSASTTQLIGGTGATGTAHAGALIINNAAAQSLSFGNLAIISGADFAPAGIVNLGTTQSISAGAITVGTTTGANGVSTSVLGTGNTAAIANLGTGDQSVSSSSINVDNQFGNGTIGIFSNTAQSISTGTVAVTNATASGIARIDATTAQTMSAGSVTVTSSGTAGEARITGATQSFGNSGIMTVQVTGGGGAARIVAAGGTQTLTSSGGFRVRATGGSGTATLANAGGPQVVSGGFVDVNTGATATGNAEFTATGDQAIHTTNGASNPDGNGSLHVAALGSGTARIESGGSQLLEIDYPELMQATRDGRITIGDATATGVSFVRAAVDQQVFARSIDLRGGQAAGATAKMTAANIQNISTLLAGITATGGSGTGASALIDPVIQNILVNGTLAVQGGAGNNALGGLTGTGSQVVLVTQGVTDTLTVAGGAGTNAFGQITTSGSLQQIGTSGGFLLTGGSGTNADAIIGASGGIADTAIACGIGTCSFAAIPSQANPFVNGVVDVGVYFNPRVVALAQITSSNIGGTATESPVDPQNLVLWAFDWDPTGDRFGRYRFGRQQPACR